MKSYTNIEQSNKLVEILPLESADMVYCYTKKGDKLVHPIPIYLTSTPTNTFKYLYCWSLSALLDILPKQIGRYTKTLYWFDDAWHCEYVDEDSEGKYGVTADNPVDACVKMIIKLKENNLL